MTQLDQIFNQSVCKIFDTQTGKWSPGGGRALNSANWSKRGKCWSGEQTVRAHLTMLLKYLQFRSKESDCLHLIPDTWMLVKFDRNGIVATPIKALMGTIQSVSNSNA